MDLQIITYDTYQNSPTPLDKDIVTFNTKPIPNYFEKLKTVPVIRIYAKVPETNTSAVVHIHNIFPYLYVHFPKATNWTNQLNGSQILELRKWFDEINFKISESFRRTGSFKKSKVKSRRRDKDENDPDVDIGADDPYADSDSNDNSGEHIHSSNCYISDISIVTGTPFYGYHNAPTTYLKISMASPKYVAKLSKLLTESKIFGKFVQPYESHVPYILQFLTDYNCYALKSITLNEYLWRSPIILSEATSDLYQPDFVTNFPEFNKLKTTDTLVEYMNSHFHEYKTFINILNPDTFPRISRTMLELDVLSAWIDNINELTERKVAQLSTGENLETDVTYISSTKSLLEDVENLRKSRGLEVDASQFSLFDKLKRNSETLWADQKQLNDQLQMAMNLSKIAFKQKYKHENYEILKREINPLPFPTSFQHMKDLQFVPNLKGNVLSKLRSKSPNLTETLAVSQPSVVEPEFQDIISDEDEDNSDEENRNDNTPKAVTHDNDHEKNDNFLIDDGNSSDNDVNENRIYNTNSISHHSSHITQKLQDVSNTDISSSNTPNIHDFPKTSFHEKSIILSHRVNIPSIPFRSYYKSNETEDVYMFNVQQPTALKKNDFLNQLEEFGLPKIKYPDPFFSKLANYDSKPFIFAGDKFQLVCPEIDKNLYPGSAQLNVMPLDTKDKYIWKYKPHKPSYADVKKWIFNNHTEKPARYSFKSQIKGPTQHFKEYKYNSLQTPVERLSGNENSMVVLIIEVHVNTRGKLMPDPKHDEVNAIFYQTNYPQFFPDSKVEKEGYFLNGCQNKDATTFKSEKDLFIGLVSLVEYLDPDIFVGFELHASSWGYILERAKHKYGWDLVERFSRVVHKHNNKIGDRYGYTHASAIKITGRQMLNLWRRLRSELTLNHYHLENIVFHIFHTRTPHFNHETLTKWWNGGRLEFVLEYHRKRINYEMELIEKLELIEKVNEQSRLLGIDFYSILYRGSQFMVECLLVRLTKAENFILISPSKKQVFKQDSLECIPLVMEPNSAFYKNPMVVLDFQSLYPSLIIAYNICYSTLLGRLKNYDPRKFTKMGVTFYKSEEGILKLLEDDVTVTPNGMIFAKQNVRKSLLAKMLSEILNVRLYIKGTMSEFKDDEELKKLYNKRQMALKLIANVTYGYTSATYSGRMSNSDIADAIVSCARETLLNAVKEIEKVDKWGAKVVYGDTDSLFVYLPGKSKDDAFKIGREMANHISMLNPAPVTLKFEKVYLPAILISKKRYIGWKFEWEGQKLPKFDAKGIETVRRDGIPAQQKILEKSISLLFETRDVSLIKEYVVDQLTKIARNKVNVKDFMFAKEVRVGTYKNEKYIPAGARLSIKRARDDHRQEPQYRERIFYLVRKPNNSKEILRDKCVPPEEFLEQGLELDSDYYINKVIIPPLERVFNLFGVDVRAWVKEIPQKLSYININTKLSNVKVRNCLVCDQTAANGSSLCINCKKNELKTMMIIKSNLKREQQDASDVINFCTNCVHNSINNPPKVDVVNSCCNDNCAIYFKRVKTLKTVETAMLCLKDIPEW